MRRRVLMAALLAGLLGACGEAPSGSDSLTRPPPIEIDEFHLENGLRVLILPDDRLPGATQMLWYRTGAADERDDEAGLAHYVEHLMFRDRRFKPMGGFSQIVAEGGGVNNAFTSSDHTVYFQRVQSDALQEMMRLEALRMRGLSLDEEDARRERGVVMEERLQRVSSSPSAALREKMRAELYGSHPYGRPISGWERTIETFTKKDALRFHERHYAPQNALLVIAGNIAPERARALAERHYGKIPRNPSWEAPRALAVPSARAGKPRVIHRDPRVRRAALTRIYLAPNAQTAPPDHAEAINILMEILGGGRVNRLTRILVEEKKVASDIYAGANLLQRGSGEIWLHLSPAPGVSLAEAERELDAILSQIINDGARDEEAALAKTKILAQWIYAHDRRQSLVSLIAEARSLGIPASRILDFPERVERVRVRTLREVARLYLSPERAVTGALEPMNP